MKKKSLGERFCNRLWGKLTAGCKKGSWRSGKMVDGIFDPQYFLKETIKEMMISKSHAKRLLDLYNEDDLYCLNGEHTCDILNNPSDAKISWFDDLMILKQAEPFYEERGELINKKFSSGLSKNEKKRLKELEMEINCIESKTQVARDSDKNLKELVEVCQKIKKLLTKYSREIKDAK